jgi:hypothetical protein
MTPSLRGQEKTVEQINGICTRLFEQWCEIRGVTPLAYLMHCWPMIEVTPIALRRVSETMQDLRRYHADQLDADCYLALCELGDLIDNLLDGRTRKGRLMAVGRVADAPGMSFLRHRKPGFGVD